MKFLVLYTLSRSGHHAIINWLCKQSGKNIHFGNVSMTEEWDIQATNCVMYENGSKTDTHYVKGEKVLLYNYDLTNYDLCIISLEDVYVGWINQHVKEEIESIPFNLYTFDIPNNMGIVLRDPYNLFSSRYQTYNDNLSRYPKDDIPRLWKSHAKNCFHNSNIGIPILFNRWASEMEYRKNLARAFGLEFSDKGFNETPLFGGSAFTGERSVFRRWIIHKEAIKRYIDPEIETLSQQLFGDII